MKEPGEPCFLENNPKSIEDISRVMIVRNKRERERDPNARSSLEVKSEGPAEYEKLTIYAAVLLRVQTMTPSVVRDNTRPSHVPLSTRVNSTMNTSLPRYLPTFHWDGMNVNFSPRTSASGGGYISSGQQIDTEYV